METPTKEHKVLEVVTRTEGKVDTLHEIMCEARDDQRNFTPQILGEMGEVARSIREMAKSIERYSMEQSQTVKDTMKVVEKAVGAVSAPGILKLAGILVGAVVSLVGAILIILVGVEKIAAIRNLI